MKTSKWMMTATLVGLFGAGAMGAGSLNPTNAPAPSMHSLEEIYQKVAYIGTNVISIVTVTNLYPTYNVSIQKTGQTISYDNLGNPTSGNKDDGDLERGVAWPVPRFTDNGNGTVSDNLTGLIWTKNANPFGTLDWTNALAQCTLLSTGEFGLSDGSTNGAWRLPNVRELFSLVDFGMNGPALPSGHPFTNYFSAPQIWSSTTYTSPFSRDTAFGVNTDSGYVQYSNKGNTYPVWPVRGGP